MIGYKFYGRNIRPYLADSEKKPYTVLGMTLFSLVVFGTFAIRPSLATISRLSREVKKANEAKTALDQKINNLSQAQVNYQLALKDLKFVEEALPKEPSVPSILETLALAAGRNNTTLNATRFERVENNGLLRALPFTVVIAGNLDGIKNFITELETGVRQMDVGQVKITQGGKDLGQVVAEIEVETHFIEGGAQ